MQTSFTAVCIATVLIAAALPDPAAYSQPFGDRHTAGPAEDAPEAPLTLERAVAHALRDSPALAAATLADAAAGARVTQAGLLPNPELAIDAENFNGNGALAGLEAVESTAVLSQPILLGGKRTRRVGVAEAERALAVRELDAVRLDVIAGATAAFYRVLAAQEREALARDLLALAERFARTVQTRVEAGKVSPVEGTRAGIEAARARVAGVRAVRDLAAVRASLAACWGASSADFERVAGKLPEPAAPPPLERLREDLGDVPEVARLDEVVEHQRRILELEESRRIPDLTLRVGPRRFQETGESAWVAGLSLAIPLFDRNQGGRRAARLELERTRRDVEAARVGLEVRLTAAFEHLRAVAEEAATLRRDVVPAAQAAFAATETGYREGKLGFLDVLDAQRALFEARSLLLDSHEAYALARTELDRLVGGRLEPPAAPASTTWTSQGEDR